MRLRKPACRAAHWHSQVKAKVPPPLARFSDMCWPSLEDSSRNARFLQNCSEQKFGTWSCLLFLASPAGVFPSNYAEDLMRFEGHHGLCMFQDGRGSGDTL